MDLSGQAMLAHEVDGCYDSLYLGKDSEFLFSLWREEDGNKLSKGDV